MMTRVETTSRALFVAAALLALLAPAAAQARDYGKFGTVEIGGSFNAQQTVADYDEDAPKTTTMGGAVQPFVGMFVLPGFQVFAQAEVAYANVKVQDQEDGDTSTTMAGGAGGAILIGLGKARLGPSLAIRYVEETYEPEGGEKTDVRVGPGAEVAGLAKLQVGGGGIITIAVFASHDLLSNEDDDYTRTTIGTRGGFSIYF